MRISEYDRVLSPGEDDLFVMETLEGTKTIAYEDLKKDITPLDIVLSSNDEYGYVNTNDQFVPFKSQADIDAAVAAAMVGTATAADVKAGVTFTNSIASGLTGTFAAQEKTVTAGTSAASVTPDNGKYLSKVTYKPTPSQEKSTTASRSAQTITPDSGKLLSKVSIAKYPDASGTYKPTANSSASDMGATNNYRYVDTRTVYNLGRSSVGFSISLIDGDVNYVGSTTLTHTTTAAHDLIVVVLDAFNTTTNLQCSISVSGATYVQIADFSRSESTYNWRGRRVAGYILNPPKGTKISYTHYWAYSATCIAIDKT